MQMWKNVDQKNSEYGHFWRSVYPLENIKISSVQGVQKMNIGLNKVSQKTSKRCVSV